MLHIRKSPAPMPTVCFALLYYDPHKAHLTPHELLDQHPFIRYLPQAVATLGYNVHFVHQYPQEETFAENGATYHFVAAGPVARFLGRTAGRLRHRAAAFYEPAFRPLQTIAALQPDLIHFHGLLDLNLTLVQRVLPQTPLLIHFHGGLVPQNRWLRQWRQHNLRRVAKVLFTTAAHAQPFLNAGLLQPSQVDELMEVSTHFQMRPRAAVRAHTNMHGHPVCLSVGRLDPIKDPLTMLQGFALIRQQRPPAQLYLYYLDAPLLNEVEQFIAQTPLLQGAVHLRGRASSAEMEAIYNSADFLLQASQREFSGFAVLEAMACGVIPIVTNIPSFETMTAGGQFGRLFPVGEAAALANQLLSLPEEKWSSLAQAIRGRFASHYSYTALANQLDELYKAILKK